MLLLHMPKFKSIEYGISRGIVHSDSSYISLGDMIMCEYLRMSKLSSVVSFDSHSSLLRDI